MRKKPNLGPRMEACDALLVHEPERLCGSWREAFPGYAALHLELGCGKGRFTCGAAAENGDAFLAAVERVPDAMVVAMERAKEQGLPNVRFLDLDAARLTAVFAPGEVDRIYINFPDPWKKSRQAKRRLTAPSFLALYEKVLKPDGEIWFKTDNRKLFLWSIEQFSQNGWGLYEVTTDLHAEGIQGVMTDYEAKFHAEGVPINRLVAKKNRGAEHE
ncbi:MAG: tRNA (guanosine(46)-N7)-methyltransferase TrmB [bacterium]